MKLQAVILDLERRAGKLSEFPTIPGTMISRCQMGQAILAREAPEIKVPPGKEAVFVWVLSLGAMNEAKRFWYGDTIISAVRKAQEGLTLIEAGKAPWRTDILMSLSDYVKAARRRKAISRP